MNRKQNRNCKKQNSEKQSLNYQIKCHNVLFGLIISRAPSYGHEILIWGYYIIEVYYNFSCYIWTQIWKTRELWDISFGIAINKSENKSEKSEFISHNSNLTSLQLWETNCEVYANNLYYNFFTEVMFCKYVLCSDHIWLLSDKSRNEKFKYIQKSMTWREAQLYCRTQYTDLATIADDTENTALTNIISKSNGHDAWIGLSKNLWLWSDQTNVLRSSVTWESGQPDNVNGNEECASAGTEGQMADVTCSDLLAFYCKTRELLLQCTLKDKASRGGYVPKP